MDWAQLVSLIPALGAIKQGGPEFNAFMQGYMGADEQLVGQDQRQQGLDQEAQRWASQDARQASEDQWREDERRRVAAERFSGAQSDLAGAIPAAAGMVSGTQPLGMPLSEAPATFSPGIEGDVPADMTGTAGVENFSDANFMMSDAIKRAAAQTGYPSLAAGTATPSVGPMVSARRRAAVEARIRSLEKNPTMAEAMASNPDMEIKEIAEVFGKPVSYRDVKQWLQETLPPPKAATSSEGKLTGEPGNRYEVLLSEWQAVHPQAAPPREVVARLRRQALNESEPVRTGTASEPGTWTDTGRLDKDGNAIYVNSKTLATKSMPFGTKPNAAADQDKAQKRQVVINATQRTLDAIDELLDEKGKLKPSALSAVGGSRVIGLWRVPGTDAYDANAAIDRVRARLVTDLMAELKAQSRTGATGFGQLNLQELKIIQDSAAKLNPGQSERAFAAELNRIRSRLEMILREPTPTAAPAPSGGTPNKVGRFEIIGVR